ncbi:MAG: hypothetical protein NXI32_28545, partial [bacterium]|nr:hypothetical protein [bacterium]
PFAGNRPSRLSLLLSIAPIRRTTRQAVRTTGDTQVGPACRAATWTQASFGSKSLFKFNRCSIQAVESKQDQPFAGNRPSRLSLLLSIAPIRRTTWQAVRTTGETQVGPACRAATWNSDGLGSHASVLTPAGDPVLP